MSLPSTSSSIEACVIPGEAPESDDEHNNSIKYGVAVEGEAPESDDELVTFRKKISTEYQNQIPGSDNDIRTKFTVKETKESLLQQKLYESNVSLWKNLNKLVHSTISDASKQLLNTDQQLLKSQVTLQSASISLKSANATSAQVLDKAKNIISGNFIPSIKL